jgi:hypothetical protein
VKKTAAEKLLAKRPGFRKAGAFYIGTCTPEVISGYALDAPPGSLCVWRFVLPAYDRIQFLHLSLARRVAEYFADQEVTAPPGASLESVLRDDWAEASRIRDAASLSTYLQQEQYAGAYPRWALYLTHVWNGDIQAAEQLESEGFPTLQLITENAAALIQAKRDLGWPGARELLTRWSAETSSKFCR